MRGITYIHVNAQRYYYLLAKRKTYMQQLLHIGFSLLNDSDDRYTYQISQQH